MKINNHLLALAAGSILVACGGGNESTDSLEMLLAKRDSLKNELTLLNELIADMDTVTKASYPLVTPASVETKDFVHKVEVQGSVDSDQNVLVTSEANGTIRHIHVKEGQKVSQGQVLVTIDSEILQSTMDEVETALEMANYMFEKQQKLMDQGVGVEVEYEQAKNQKKSLEKKLQTMRSQKGKTIVRAPFSGVIDEVMVSLGDMASPMTPMLRLVNNRDIKVTASLSENLLANIQLGTPVDLVIPAMNDTVINGVVSYKGNFIDPVNRTFRIHVNIKNNSILLTNMLAKVNVVDFMKKGAMVVNSECILQDTQNNNYVYKIIKDGEDTYKLEKVFVVIEKSYNGESCIEPVVAGSLNSGEQIVLGGAKGITATDIVKFQ